GQRFDCGDAAGIYPLQPLGGGASIGGTDVIGKMPERLAADGFAGKAHQILDDLSSSTDLVCAKFCAVEAAGKRAVEVATLLANGPFQVQQPRDASELRRG